MLMTGYANMFEQLAGVEERFVKLESFLSDPEIIKDQGLYQRYSKEHGELNKIISVFREYNQVRDNIVQSEELLKDGDEEIELLAREDIDESTKRVEKL